jgi:hypothetical protein
MQNYRRFTLMALPQFFNGTELALNIVVLPRNQNPLAPAIEGDPTVPNAVAFANANLTFSAKIISGLTTFPNSLAASDTQGLVTAPPVDAATLFTALGQQFQIQNLSSTNQLLDNNKDRANLKPAVPQELSVFKYLPVSYRLASNFTTPRTRNASTGDAYSCAVRGSGFVPGFQRSSDEISWGKVFAYALRQPLIATQLGMIYSTTLTISAADFPHGGWLYVDLADDSDYKAQQTVEDSFIKKYAVRIPALTLHSARQVFAPILIPVLFKAKATDPDPAPDGNYDDLFLEAAEYDDGFAKIAHAVQPVSLNLLAEESDGAHPLKDIGIRLGWDDEQILIWYMRQMMIDPTVTGPDKRLDAPLAVFGYAIDVRESATPANDWESLTLVESRVPLVLQFLDGGDPASITLGDFSGELPYQVYPSQLDGDLTKSYWLPMYFAAWNGHSMVLPDEDAANIYQNTGSVRPDPVTLTTGTGVSGPAQNQASKIYQAPKLNTALLYGGRYEFRMRLRDLSGGGTDNDPSIKPINISPSSVGRCHFKRYVAPHHVRVKNLAANTDLPTDANAIDVARPLLGYPAVTYTGKYADPVALLAQASQDMVGTEAFGIEDPDVDRVEVTVEVETLRMDNLLSVSGKDNYVLLYKTLRAFPPIAAEADFKKDLNIPVIYKDCNVLHVGSELDLVTDLGLSDDIDKLTEIVLPTARTIRITLRAVCEDKANNADYYGLVSKDPEMDTRFGRTLQMRLYKESTEESDLFLQSPPDMIRGIYLQPDPPAVFDGNFLTLLFGQEIEKAADLIQRFCKQLNLENIGLTLTGAKGRRVQFGCSNRIRHTLSPESSSLTFSSKGDLMNHWLSCITLDLNRDWTWDALASHSFVIERTLRFTHDLDTETETEVVGDIEIRHTASFEALQDPQRDFTRVIFIDAIDPKTHRMRSNPNQNEPRFPDTIQVTYSIAPAFKGSQPVEIKNLALDLPITTPPTQIPKIVSAGLALSSYQRNEKYSTTEPRRRYLWIEFEEPIRDPQDTYFARVLAYAPDQLISNNHPELLVATDEPVLPVDPEFIRVIQPPVDPTVLPTNDLAGLNAMQPMEKASDSDLHYLLPLPSGLHADAPEMFGFFTYEFRVGHYRLQLPQDTGMSWCTAQGRFGRPLRATGIQHPAPTLTCSANRDQDRLYVVAPYAVAVLNGANYTADPPRTQLWCLLYAQVHQADKRDFLNILLDDKRLDWRVQIDLETSVNNRNRYSVQERALLKKITIANFKEGLDYAKAQNTFKLIDTSQTNKDATRYGTAMWSNDEVEQFLQNYGLPVTSPLSVLVVEMLPTITRFSEHYSAGHEASVRETLINRLQLPPLQTGASAYTRQSATTVDDTPGPLSEELGQHRILRSSPLTEVPYVC